MTTNFSAKSEKSLRTLIAKHELSVVADEIVNQAKEFVPLYLGKKENYRTLGNSRYGGVPDLPSSITWPMAEGRFLNFLMQINLAEVPKVRNNPLPKSGLLYFFLEDDGACTDVTAKVIWAPKNKATLRKSPVTSHLAHEEFENLKPYQLMMGTGIDIPSYGSVLFEKARTEAPATAAGDGADRLFALINAASGKQPRQKQVGQLLGCPSHVGSDMRENAHLRASGKENRIYDYEYRKRNKSKLRAAAAEWEFVWRIGSSFEVGACIWDFGSLNVFVQTQELRTRDFSNAYVQVETS